MFSFRSAKALGMLTRAMAGLVYLAALAGFTAIAQGRAFVDDAAARVMRAFGAQHTLAFPYGGVENPDASSYRGRLTSLSLVVSHENDALVLSLMSSRVIRSRRWISRHRSQSASSNSCVTVGTTE